MLGKLQQWGGLHSEQLDGARNEMGGACGTYGGEQICTQVFDGETGRK